MNRKFILSAFVLFLVLANDASAQRYLAGQCGWQITAGSVNGLNINKGFHVGIAFSRYTKNANCWLFCGEYLEKRYSYKNLSLPQSQFTVGVGYNVQFLSDGGKTVFLSLGMAAMAGYETVNWNSKLLFDGATVNNKDAFLYGGALTLETEIFLTDRIVMLLNVRERLLDGSSIGKLNTLFGMGIKYIIN